MHQLIRRTGWIIPEFAQCQPDFQIIDHVGQATGGTVLVGVDRRFDGLEASLNWRPTDRLSLFASDPEDLWSTTEDEGVLNTIMDMVESEEVIYEFVTH